MTSSQLTSLTTYAHGIFLTKKASSDQIGVQPLAKMFLYFEIIARSPNLNSVSFSLASRPKSTCVFYFTPMCK